MGGGGGSFWGKDGVDKLELQCKYHTMFLLMPFPPSASSSTSLMKNMTKREGRKRRTRGKVKKEKENEKKDEGNDRGREGMKK